MQFSSVSYYLISFSFKYSLSTQISNILRLFYFHDVRDQVLHPYENTMITILYSLESRSEDKNYELCS
jgi:hypothetical protein